MRRLHIRADKAAEVFAALEVLALDTPMRTSQRDSLALTCGVSPGTIERARAVLLYAPDLKAKVLNGQLKMAGAGRLAHERQRGDGAKLSPGASRRVEKYGAVFAALESDETATIPNSMERIAAACGVSLWIVAGARAVRSYAPELVASVLAGEITLGRAAVVAHARHPRAGSASLREIARHRARHAAPARIEQVAIRARIQIEGIFEALEDVDFSRLSKDSARAFGRTLRMAGRAVRDLKQKMEAVYGTGSSAQDSGGAGCRDEQGSGGGDRPEDDDRRPVRMAAAGADESRR
jgi:hypothetical protein